MKAYKFVKRTIYFKSRSKSGEVYKTERHRNGSTSCFCPGNVYTGNCWHRARADAWR